MSIDVDFRKSFGTFHLNVRLKAGDDIIALLGASGCGKSLTLKCIAGIFKPDEGHIIVDGTVLFDSEKKINLTPQERHIGMLFQNYALFPNMTVAQNISCGIRSHPTGAQRQQIVQSLIDTFYLDPVKTQYPHQLSGGQQQRTALARIFASDPRIILLDEPLSALDSYLRWQLEQELIDSLDLFKGTTLYVSHSMGEVFRICKYACVMESGKNEPLTKVHSLMNAPSTFSTALLSGCKNFSRVKRLGERTVWAYDWNVPICLPEDSQNTVNFIGIHARSIQIGCHENQIQCKVTRIIPDISSIFVTLEPDDIPEKNNFSKLLMEVSPSACKELSVGNKIQIGFPKEDLLVLQ